jgi:hypothetical protein
MRSILTFLRLVRKLWKLDHSLMLIERLRDLECSGVWQAAGASVESVMAQKELSYAAEIEPQTRFCPMCGQIPDGDRRMDHARKLTIESLGDKPFRRHEIDAAISLHYLLRKSRKKETK